jgi:hypothetical protein
MDWLEGVQRRAARFVYNDAAASVSKMMGNLKINGYRYRNLEVTNPIPLTLNPAFILTYAPREDPG